ncbi:MAG: hypothetical protein ACE5LU_28140 [Anaerolineae bacterium]
MAKKSRKGRYRRPPQMYPKGAPTSSSVKVGRPGQKVRGTPARESTSLRSSDELRAEYWYVYNDLKRIAVVAGALFAILIGLSFIIR